MRIHLQSVGCRLNEAELENWAEDFRGQNHRIARSPDDADLIVFNSCAVTQQAVRNSRQAIRKLQRETPGAKVVATGCYASLDPAEAAELGVDLVVENKDKDRLVEIARRELDLPSMPEAATAPGESALFARGRQRAFVKVQDGCRYRCTYCIVTIARGDERSKPIAEVVNEINRLADSGIREVVLTGVHLGGYGSDLGCHLTDLVRAVLNDTAVERVRLGSLEPWELPDSFFALFDNPRLMPHLHLPLQSGADSVLRRMSRRCRTAEFAELIDAARCAIPDFNVTTDIIVGFPGETEAEWRSGIDYIERIGFGHCHIFSYSPRAGTKAARLPDPVDKSIKKQRSAELHTLARQMKSDTFAHYLQREFPVLLEGEGQPLTGNRRRYFGYTPNYLRVAVDVDDNKAMSNSIIPAVLSSHDSDSEFLLATTDR